MSSYLLFIKKGENIHEEMKFLTFDLIYLQIVKTFMARRYEGGLWSHIDTLCIK
ncbi:hypothetical protein BAOM_3429 [Peribacillus asahii]|uniref:Uncharacterized protein n=1 Tax=Peribacillus asahii TaxID=228899 RepID=A0A3T0KUP1_9BACI|nr:hypothetical protein BAOM_3429 [Peribacillus asahii]